MSRRQFEGLLGAVICALALAFLHWGIPAWVEPNDLTAVPPDLQPRVATGLIALLGALMAGHRWLFDRSATAPAVFDGRLLWGFGVVLLLFGVAVALMLGLGYLAGGAFIVAALMLYMGARRWPLVLAVSIGAPAALYAVFHLLLGVPLP